ncbi:hypothetical protein C882_4354 [Caenispirillum salinarum AK4]|uniref:CysZ-like protein n=1 Tax=Caenispirillum salinarum AK4 TaxID=1238182 RepID=K9GWL1_9PROT|nr:EI24 domain-containing protein [Caenispirillum salinarum]EKV30395.1 hypothetical protein C882_4354 [Caenispirillum salinarum AK4]
MIDAFVKAFAQLPDKRIRGVVIVSLLGALAIYLALAGALWWALTDTVLVSLPWVEALLDVLGGVAVFVLSLLFFPAVVTMIIGFFLEQVADAVEARHYPGLPPNREQPVWEIIGSTAKFAAVAIGLNILALPLYLLLLFIPGSSLVLFYALNGYLLSREYFEAVALRRADAATVKSLRRQHTGRLWLVGAAITFLATVPFVNMLAPVVGTAAMTHVATGLMRRHKLLDKPVPTAEPAQ